MTCPITAAELVDASYEYEDIASITAGQGVELASGYSDSESICDYDSRPGERRTWCRLTPYFFRREDCLHQATEPRKYRRVMEPELQRRVSDSKGGDLVWRPSYGPRHAQLDESQLFAGPAQPRFGQTRDPLGSASVGRPPIAANTRADELWSMTASARTLSPSSPSVSGRGLAGPGGGPRPP